jgi:hypothetical protein
MNPEKSQQRDRNGESSASRKEPSMRKGNRN